NTYALLIDQFAANSANPGAYYCNAIEFRNSLMELGWSKSSFSYLFGNDEITQTNLKAKMDDLEQKVDSNDVVIVFFAAHGYGCLRDILDLNSWFHEEFLEIPTDYKILLIDACHAGEFIEPLAAFVENETFFAMGSVAATEFAIAFTYDDSTNWNYSEPQFYGIISSHFWSQALTNQSADENLDSHVSLTEMYDFSFPIIRTIYSEVFLNDPEITEFVDTNTGYHDNYPNPEVISNLDGNFSLDNEYLQTHIEQLMVVTPGEKLAIILGSVGTVVILTATITVVVLRGKKKKQLKTN
ncbi:MAG: caspase family protein, partial [Candidatus Thorarchaeota archaeon]